MSSRGRYDRLGDHSRISRSAAPGEAAVRPGVIRGVGGQLELQGKEPVNERAEDLLLQGPQVAEVDSAKAFALLRQPVDMG